MAAVQLTGVQKAFGDVQVLRDIDLEVRDGEFVVFVGPSGCGKSTLLRVIAGLEDITGGTLKIGDVVVNDVPPAERGIAMVFQSYALYPHMDLYENMAFGLKLAKLPPAEIDSAVNNAAKILHIEHLLKRKPKDLSGGQRQRVAIGRAIVRKPEVFLFDEPLSNLDSALRMSMRYEFAKLHEELKTTMVYVTHDQVEAMTLADRIVVMNQGRIEQVAAPMALYEKPSTRFVAGFVGSPAMNFIPVQRQPDAQGQVVVTLPGGTSVSTRVAANLAATDGLQLGLRPEALTPAADGPLAGSVEVIERLGDRSYLHVQLPDGGLIVADGSQRAEPRIGDAIRLQPDLSRAHLFDASGHAHHAS